MTGIDTVAAAILASRVDSLFDAVQPSSGSAVAPQAGASGAAAAAAWPGGATGGGPPAASAQAVLSELGLVLDAISRLGGDATPAVIGAAPLLSAAQLAGLAVPGRAVPNAGAGTATGLAGAGVPQPPQTPQAAPAAQTSQAAQAVFPVAALSVALVRAVDESGLFYESHLVQWLAGQRTAAELAREPQARLVSGWRRAAELNPAADALADWFAARMPLPSGARSGNAPPAAGEPWRAAGDTAGRAVAPGRDAPNLAPSPRAVDAYATLVGANASLAPQSAPATGARFAPASPLAVPFASPPGDADAQATVAAALNPATLPLVRQQLDLLATGQFRWIGDAWPGARLDWTIEPDAEQRGRDRAALGIEAADAGGWRTRLTLALPSLGTVAAELVLSGECLAARLSASGASAVRLASQGDALRARLEALGLRVSDMSIRATDGPHAGHDATAARATASAYAAAADDASRNDGASLPASRVEQPAADPLAPRLPCAMVGSIATAATVGSSAPPTPLLPDITNGRESLR
ncbi:flagellar hook-length control protein FliK [Burkholderia sp. TSV86]|uniref:flagellar hook-length control protein FliK n=1 Tax=Burkholderia sp. TSV86 TaxID=1385594 RepID=UPI00075C509E|nr:flagellar hook-length control protein FliK [Burkholderia sp. TSV86]KVE33335.1 hypothetical protein WS68_13120 [Burkholderia sp. TSV86]